MTRRFRSLFAALAACACSLGGSRATRADGCGKEEKRPPSAGHWKGTFKATFEMAITGLPGSITTTTTWQGSLSFDLGRTELDDTPAPVPPLPPLRPPLRPRGAKPPGPEAGAAPRDRAAH